MNAPSQRRADDRSEYPGSAVFEPGFAGPVQFDDFDAIRAASPSWDHAHTQLGRGGMRMRVTVAHAGRMELAVVSRTPGVLIQGAPPPGMTVLAVNLHGPSLQVQRVRWENDLVCVLRRGLEFELSSNAPHQVSVLCVDRERLDEEALTCWDQRFPRDVSGPCIRFRDDASRRRLLGTWARWLDSARRHPEMLRNQDSVAHMQRELIRAVLCSVHPVPAGPPVRAHRDLALRAEAFIRRTLDEPVRIEDVCTAANASRQSLHRSFRAVYGISPQAYRKALRLSAARNELKGVRLATTVTDVATRWGFFRLGHFSADYFEMFREYPSETLRRALGRPSVSPGACTSGRGVESGPQD